MLQGNDTVSADAKRLTAALMAQYAAFSLSLQLPESVFQARPIHKCIACAELWRTYLLRHARVEGVLVPALGGDHLI